MLCESCKTEVRPVFACDIDGTISDYHGPFLEFAWRWLYGAECLRRGLLENYDGSMSLADYLGISKDLYRQIKLAYRQGGGKRFQPFMGELPTFQAQAERVDLWLTTTRPYNKFDSTDPDTRQWLEWHGIVYKGLIYDEDKYERLVEIVDPERIIMVLDDEPEQVKSARDLGLPVLWRSTPYNRALSADADPVTNLIQVSGHITHRLNQWREEHGC